MKIKFSPQVYLKKDIEYIYGEEQILAKVYKVTLDENNEEVDREIEKTFYADFSQIEYEKIYPVNMPLSHVSRDENGELYIELVNYIGYEATEEENFPEEFIPSTEDIEIPEDAKIIQMEEMVISEPEPSPVDSLKAENHELRQSIQSLKDSMVKSNKNTEDLIVTLLSMM